MAGQLPLEETAASSTSRWPRRASTDAVVSETARASASARTSACVHCSSCQVPVAIGFMTVRTGSDGALARKPLDVVEFSPRAEDARRFALLRRARVRGSTRIDAGAPDLARRHGLRSPRRRSHGRAGAAAHHGLLPATDPDRTPKGVTTVDPAQAGAVADVDVGRLRRPRRDAGGAIAVPVQYSAERAAVIVSDLAAQFDRPAIDATVTGATRTARCSHAPETASQSTAGRWARQSASCFEAAPATRSRC